MQGKTTRALVESALLAAIGVVLVLIGYYAPILGTIAMFLWPLPSAIAVLRHGPRWGLLSSIVTGLGLLLFMDWFTALGLWVLFALTGITFGYAIRKGYSSFTVILLTSVAFLVGVLVSFLSLYLMAGFTPSDLLDNYINAMKAASEMSEKVLGPGAIENQFGDFEVIKQQLLRILPGAVLVSALLQSYLNFEVGRRVLVKVGYNLEPLPPFSQWLFPEYLGFGAVMSFLALILGQQYAVDVLSRIGENAFFIFSLILFIQGASLISYYLLRARFPRILVGAFIVYLYFAQGLNTIVILVGLTDILFDLRHLRYGWLDEI